MHVYMKATANEIGVQKFSQEDTNIFFFAWDL